MFFRMSYWTSYLDTLIHFRFRHVNRRARILASELQEYKCVVKHGMEGFRSMLRTRLATHFTFGDMYSALTTETCSLCKNFGDFLFLPTATRCCFACIENAPELRVISLVAFKKLTKVKMKWLTYHIGRVVRTVPGLYSMGEKPARRPGLLLAEVEVARMLSALCLLTPEANEALEMQNEKKNYRFMVSTAYPWYDPNTGQVHSGVSCKGCQIRLETLAVASRDHDGVFSSSGYQSHFETCTEAKALFKKSAGGTRKVVEPQFTRRKGYFNTLDRDGLPR
ncbi:hypothetical protein FOPG_09078 [Fusarium oxysporum f. sp. conglutinans race 2 54008]|uniref:F-box domain-containing protein n=1 Tax=Fusarium oxysporum f. sp. conglutinans race 2 54008 TaxID=1089457 RepID=X0HVZ9_FUSOX|nr:hypothetical protein FOPG_09078 [Fusarium oxysporum f. sp. conglutinans race 2 54008]